MLPLKIFSFYPSLIFSFILINIGFEFIKFDEEFIIFISLLIVFLTLVENLGKDLQDSAEIQLSKLKSFFQNKQEANAFLIQEQLNVLNFLDEFFLEKSYFILKTQLSFIEFFSFEFYVTELYLNLLIKETLINFEILETKALMSSEALYNSLYLVKVNASLVNKNFELNSENLQQIFSFILKKKLNIIQKKKS